jgi:DNA-binding LytR/AlgR family response regulator
MRFPLRTFIIEDTKEDMSVLLERMDKLTFDPYPSVSLPDARSVIKSISGKFDLSIFDVYIGNQKSYVLIDEFTVEKFGLVAFTNVDNSPDLSYVPPTQEYLCIFRKPYNRYSVEKVLKQIKEYVRDSMDTIPRFRFITDKNDYITVKRRDIIYFSGKKDYSTIFYYETVYVDGEKTQQITPRVVKHSLVTLRNHLGEDQFFKIRQSFLINEDYFNDFIYRPHIFKEYAPKHDLSTLIIKLSNRFLPKRKKKPPNRQNTDLIGGDS